MCTSHDVREEAARRAGPSATAATCYASAVHPIGCRWRYVFMSTVCAFVRAYVYARAEAFTDLFAVDFWFRSGNL